MDDDYGVDRPQCTCEKTECLRRYCRCFDSMWFCSEECTCRGCRNTEDNADEVEERVENIRRKKPDAFMDKIADDAQSAAGSVVTQQQQGKEAMMAHVKGCNCRRSGCKKLYCECHKHKVGCSARCRCAGCANTYGTKGGCFSMTTSEIDEVDSNDIPNEIASGVSQSYSLPTCEEKQQRVNDNVSPNETIDGFPSSSLPVSEADQQKDDSNVSPNEISDGSQSSFLLASKTDQQKVDTNDSSHEISGGFSGATAASNETSLLLDDDMFYLPTEKITLDDFLANLDPSCGVDSHIQPLDDNNFDDVLHQLLGDRDDVQHNIHPQIDQGFAQTGASQLKTYQGIVHVDESQLKTHQESARADKSQLKSFQGSAQAHELQLNNAKGPSNLHTSNINNVSQNNPEGVGH